MDFRQAQADIITLLADSPITSRDAIDDIRESVRAGEISIAFDTLCSSIFEQSLSISHKFYTRLSILATEIEETDAMDGLDELIIDTPSEDTSSLSHQGNQE